MTDRPMLFSGPMIRALLAGRKTQTRRALKFQPAPGISIIRKTIRPLDAAAYHAFERRSVYGNYAGELDVKIKRSDRLWVRETWQGLSFGDYLPTKSRQCELRYAATDPCADLNAEARGYPWRPSIFMPRWASRITLSVTDVRVERLQDISEADAIAEGIEPHFSGWMPYSTMFYQEDGVTPANYHRDPRISYEQLWNKINGRGAWDINPWVVAYTFDVALRNIDEVA